MRINYYFCGVKSSSRYEAAASKQRFLCPKGIVKNKSIEWVNGNVPKASANLSLTTRNALSFV